MLRVALLLALTLGASPAIAVIVDAASPFHRRVVEEATWENGLPRSRIELLEDWPGLTGLDSRVADGRFETWYPDGRRESWGSYRRSERTGISFCWARGGALDLARSGLFSGELRLRGLHAAEIRMAGRLADQ